MSVIVGISQLHGVRARSLEIRSMLDRLAHCAPDGLSAWSDREIALGHGMLHSTRESLHEKLPLHIPGANLAITADARIDNRGELIHACGLSRPYREVTDSELILAAYQRWGRACVETLLGDFAFAIWDGSKRELFCARDPFGIRPFFYHSDGHRFAFASHIKALFALPEVSSSWNESRIADHILGFFQDRTSTFFEGVHRLPPAHFLVWGANGLSMQRYWTPNPSAETRRSSDQEYSDEFRSIFAEAVRCRLRSAFPLGTMLSGGLDSSSIACMARDQMRAESDSAPLHTYSGLFIKNAECNERRYLESVLKGEDFLPHFIDCDQVNPFAELDRVHAEQNEVSHSAGPTLVRLVYASARQDGVRVVLDGAGGDEVVGHGMRCFNELLWNGSYSEFSRQILNHAHNFDLDPQILAGRFLRRFFLELQSQRKWLTLGSALMRIPLAMHDSAPRFFWNNALQPLAHKLQRRIVSAIGGDDERSGSLLNREFAEAILLRERHRQIRQPEPVPGHNTRQAQCHWFNSGVLWMTMEEQSCAAAAAHIDPRYPMLDKRLVEFCVSLPASQKMSQGWTRAVFRRAMQNVVPDEVRWRGGKALFTGVFEQCLKGYGRQLLDNAFLHTPPSCSHYFNLPVLRERYRRFLAGDGRRMNELWRAANLIQWIENSKLAADRSEEPAEPCEVGA